MLWNVKEDSNKERLYLGRCSSQLERAFIHFTVSEEGETILSAHCVNNVCVCVCVHVGGWMGGILPRISFHLQNPLRGLVVPGCTSVPSLSLFLPPFPSVLQLPSALASETDENFHLLWLNLA